jgi:hypothetical protein
VIRALLALVLLAGVAHADTASETKATADAALARWDAASNDRGIFAKLWDLVESSAWDQMKLAKQDVLYERAGIEKKLEEQELVDAELKLADLKTSVAAMDRTIAAYQASTKSTVWKLQLGIGLFIVGVFGMTIWRFVRRRVRR